MIEWENALETVSSIVCTPLWIDAHPTEREGILEWNRRASFDELW